MFRRVILERHGEVVEIDRSQVGLEPVTGRLLRSLFDRRKQADYTTTTVNADEAGLAIIDATSVIDAVTTWLERRTPPS